MFKTVKEAVLEIKEIVFNNHNIDIEKYAEQLISESFLTFDDVKNLFNNMTLYYMSEQNPVYNHANRKAWSTSEDNLILQYVELSSTEIVEGKKKKARGKVFQELSEVLNDRTFDAISFRFYEVRKSQVEADKVVETKIAAEEPKTPVNTEDTLDMVVDIIENVEAVGLDINGLFKSLQVMSKRAVENSNVQRVEELEGKVDFLESELDKERAKNDSLQLEVARLVSEFEKVKREVEYFDGLNGKQKLQQLQNFNKKIKYMVDKFGGVISVAVETA